MNTVSGHGSQHSREPEASRWQLTRTRIVHAIFPAVSTPAPPPSAEELASAIARYEELSRTVRRVFHTLLATELFCLVTLAVPDSQLVLAEAQVTLPILQIDVSFASFLIVGPALIIGLTTYLHIFYGSLRQSAFHGVERLSNVYGLFNLGSVTAQWLAWVLIYWSPVVVLSVFAWKALPRPILGYVLVWVTLLSALSLVVLQLRRCPPRWRGLAAPILGTGTLAVVLALFATAGADLRRVRTLDLFKGDFSQKDLRDVDLRGANMRDANLEDAILRRANLATADLSGAALQHAKLDEANLRGARLVGAKLAGATLKGSRFDDANLQHADFGSTLEPNEPLPVDAIRGANNWMLAFYHGRTLGRLGLDPATHNQRIREKQLTHVSATGATLRNADLSGFDLSGADLPDADLSGADLAGARLVGTVLDGANLAGARLEGANLQGARLHEAKATYEQIRRANNWALASYDQHLARVLELPHDHDDRIANRKLTGTNLEGARLRNAELERFDLTGAQLRNADLSGARLREALLVNSDLRNSILVDAVLAGANLQGARLEGALLPDDQVRLGRNWVLAHYDAEALARLDLPKDQANMLRTRRAREVELSGADLRDAALSGFDLYAGRFVGADLGRADLRGAFLAFADLTGANLANARLDTANLTDANLTGAVLENASLAGAILVRARLDGAVLTQVELAETDLRYATLDCTQLRAGTNWPLALRDETLSCTKQLPPAPRLADSVARHAPPDLAPDLRAQVTTQEATSPDRAKPHASVVTLGHVDHGKTTLVAAIDKIAAHRQGRRPQPFAKINDAPEVRAQGISIAMSEVEYETANRRYTQLDMPGHADLIKALITGVAKTDGAVLVVSAADGPMPQTREHILLARQAGISSIVVYLNKVDLVDDEQLLDLVELEVRELLSKYDFPGDDIPVIRGSALEALQGSSSELGVPSVERLLDAFDAYIPQPEPGVDAPFLMPVEDVFTISGRGTVATGRVERGQVRTGDKVEIVGIRKTSTATVTGVEMFRKGLRIAKAGDNVGCVLSGVERKDIERGQVLAEPGSITPETRFEGEVYILTRDEGGRHTPFFDGYRPQFYFRTTDVAGEATLPGDTEIVMPGDNILLTVMLTTPIAMRPGLRFAIREGGRTIGVGLVTKLLD